MRKSGGWYEVLGAVRRICARTGTFTVHDLVAEAGIRAGEKASAQQVASAWLAKLTGWGYVEKAGEIEQEGRRPLFSYSITKEGRKCEVRQGKSDRLIAAVRAYQHGRGTRNDAALYAELIKVCDAVEAEMWHPSK